jgi:hypothetical protein
MPAPPHAVPPFVAYPSIWRQACELYPSGPHYCWRERWRCLTRLAHEFRAGPFVHLLALAGPGERALIQSLAECDAEALALEFLAWCPGDVDPLVRLDPTDPFAAATAPAAEDHSHERE